MIIQRTIGVDEKVIVRPSAGGLNDLRNLDARCWFMPLPNIANEIQILCYTRELSNTKLKRIHKLITTQKSKNHGSKATYLWSVDSINYRHASYIQFFKQHRPSTP
jgi:hypothetical protein